MLAFLVFINFINSPYAGMGVLALLVLSIVCTLMVIHRSQLRAIQSVTLLLLIWFIPVLGVTAVLVYLWVTRPQRSLSAT